MSATIANQCRPEVVPLDAGAAANRNQVEVVNPLSDPAWDLLLEHQPEASFFHGAAWASVLSATYGHQPFYFCSRGQGKTQELLPVMEVCSPLTGRRGVSLPFTDFCSPLRGPAPEGSGLFESAVAHGARRGWRYLESRGGNECWPGSSMALEYWAHVVDLSSGPDKIFGHFDASVRRAIRKAERALTVEFGQSEDSMRRYFELHCGTRRRHGLPPQPWKFFQNIARHVMQPGLGFLATALLNGRAVASAVFFRSFGEAIYKFGASDYKYQHLRPNNLVMWAGIRKCAEEGQNRLHLGRTSIGNEGLRRFKLGFGAREEKIGYCRYDIGRRVFASATDRAQGPANAFFRCLPVPVLRLAGRLLYPHLS